MNVSLKQLHVFSYKLLSLWVLVNVVQAIKFHPHELCRSYSRDLLALAASPIPYSGNAIQPEINHKNALNGYIMSL